MATKSSNGLTGWLHDMKNRATQAVTDKEAAFVRGKVAGARVLDDHGAILVEPGQHITDEIIERSRRIGKIPALTSSVMRAQGQDIREKVETTYANSDRAREARLLDTVEEYREARTYLRRVLTMDVTDVRGHVVVPAGKSLDDEDIRLARDQGLLSALLYAAQQAVPAPLIDTSSAPNLGELRKPAHQATALNGDDGFGTMETTPISTAQPVGTRGPVRRAPLLTGEDSDGQ